LQTRLPRLTEALAQSLSVVSAHQPRVGCSAIFYILEIASMINGL
jgi:hypothetical protein